ncbi:extracellular catalytic domain type 1 short-chain-length polyhydroxyalkanoate depolymerase [Massilia sp. TWP1-3-3]|uniref:extracellular catalytic domain type 1 short-chain-length polyhydroxyalkanoate depolymerase n=1 Tax=Massilia sp. TWP1-3-3 TaxID=2804573 RepID=UPI003CF43EBA
MLNPMFDAWASLCSVNPFAWDCGQLDVAVAPSRARAAKLPPSLIAQRLVTDAGSLDYKLYVPASYTGRPAALLVMLHGCSQDGADFARGTGMNELAEQYQCLVAYPEQSSSSNGGKCWNWFEPAHHHRGGGEPALIAGVANKVMDEYVIDPAKVFIAGLSAGGAMAVVLGRTYPDLFCAVGCHSGLAHGCAVGTGQAMQAMQYGEAAGAAPLAGALPLIVFHGDMDSTVHPRNGDGVIAQSVDLSRLRPGTVQTGQATGRSFTRTIHRGPSGAVMAEHWTVHGSGHAWSGGRRQGSYTDASGPDASGEMMRFFMEVSDQRQ